MRWLFLSICVPIPNVAQSRMSLTSSLERTINVSIASALSTPSNDEITEEYHADERKVPASNIQANAYLFNLGDKILNNLSKPSTGEHAQLVNDLAAKIGALVEKMWVKTPTSNMHQQDILLHLKSGTLNNTDLRISHSDKGISIQFLTSDINSYHLLATNQVQLRRQLQKKYSIDNIEISRRPTNPIDSDKIKEKDNGHEYAALNNLYSTPYSQ